MSMDKRAYLFSFKYWQDSPPKYLLVYAETEDKARLIAQSKCVYNNRSKAELKDIISCNYE